MQQTLPHQETGSAKEAAWASRTGCLSLRRETGEVTGHLEEARSETTRLRSSLGIRSYPFAVDSQPNKPREI